MQDFFEKHLGSNFKLKRDRDVWSLDRYKSESNLLAHISMLEDLFSIDRKRAVKLINDCPDFLRYSKEFIEGRIADFAEVLKLSPENIKHMIGIRANLITYSKEKVEARAQNCENLFSVNREQIGKMFFKDND